MVLWITVFPLISAGHQISATLIIVAPLAINIEIIASPLSTASRNMTLIRIVTTLY